MNKGCLQQGKECWHCSAGSWHNSFILRVVRILFMTWCLHFHHTFIVNSCRIYLGSNVRIPVLTKMLKMFWIESQLIYFTQKNKHLIYHLPCILRVLFHSLQRCQLFVLCDCIGYVGALICSAQVVPGRCYLAMRYTSCPNYFEWWQLYISDVLFRANRLVLSMEIKFCRVCGKINNRDVVVTTWCGRIWNNRFLSIVEKKCNNTIKIRIFESIFGIHTCVSMDSWHGPSISIRLYCTVGFKS